MSAPVTVVAHPNIALVKYWGKRDAALNLPAAGSLSVTLGPMHTRTTVSFGHAGDDRFVLNDVVATGREAAKLTAFVERIRAHLPGLGALHMTSTNDFPTAAGLASSSSGFAALALATSQAAALPLTPSELSELARLGSGSAARSIFGGLVRMDPGQLADGSDAVASPVDVPVDQLRVLVAVTVRGAKEVASTDGMNHTMETSPFYRAWIDTVAPAIDEAIAALRADDWDKLSMVCEASALQMHASAIAAVPGVLYWRGATVELIHAVRRQRAAGMPVFLTIDAGPHVKVFTRASHENAVAAWLRDVPGVLEVLHAAPAPGAVVVP